MRLLILLFTGLFTQTLLAQGVEATVGDSVELLAPVYKTNYKNIDYFKKTRWADTTSTWQWETGYDYYEYFFSKGDFDVKRCPVKYEGTRLRISAIQHYKDSTGQTSGRTVFMCTPPWNKREMFWIEVENGLSDGEFKVIPIRRKR
jgi:hypothetical protein